MGVPAAPTVTEPKTVTEIVTEIVMLKPGPRPSGNALSNAERQRRWRARHKARTIT
jgi:hypothetical protein